MLIFSKKFKTHFFSEQFFLISYNTTEALPAIIKSKKQAKLWTSAGQQATREFSKFKKSEKERQEAKTTQLLDTRPTSTTSERKFKVGYLIQKDKPSLLQENLENLVFMKLNLKAIVYRLNLPPTCKALLDFQKLFVR